MAVRTFHNICSVSAVAIVTCTSAIVGFISLIGDLDPVYAGFVLNLGISTASLSCILVFFSPKLYLLYIGAVFDANLQVTVAATSATGQSSKGNDNKQEQNGYLSKIKFIQVGEVLATLKSAGKDANFKMCNDQINAAHFQREEVARKHITEWMEIAHAVDENRLYSVLHGDCVLYYNQYRLDNGSAAASSVG